VSDEKIFHRVEKFFIRAIKIFYRGDKNFSSRLKIFYPRHKIFFIVVIKIFHRV